MATSSIAVTPPAHTDWRKMNKQELRDALASRGLDTNGLRPLLIQRLESSVKSLAAAEALTNAHGKSQNLFAEASPTKKSAKSESEKIDASTRLQQDGTATSDMSKDRKVQDTKEAQVTPIVSGTDADKLAAKSDGTKLSVAASTFPDNSKGDASSINTGTLSDLDKKRLRAKKFGVGLQVTEQEKLAIRAERFSGAQSKRSSMQKPEAEKRKERAARFGIADEESKKKARQERFSPTSKQASAEEKRKARAARFGAATEQGSLQVK